MLRGIIHRDIRVSDLHLETGTPTCPRTCPIAQAVSWSLWENGYKVQDILVNHGSIQIDVDGQLYIMEPLPKAAEEFMTAFDTDYSFGRPFSFQLIAVRTNEWYP